MTLNRAALESLAESVGDGAPIAWDAIEAQASESERPIIHQLRVLESLAHLHRTLPPEGASAPRPAGQVRSSSAPAIGTWGPLALLERLGGGTFGEVYRAWDAQLERDVALKVLRGDAPDASRLLNEARLLARVHHPNVVTVHGVDTYDGRAGLWMELIHGVSLEQVLASQGPFSAREAAVVGIDLCRALAALHAKGLVHRDVKAQNVLREAGGRIVLMDLGTGRDVDRGEPLAGVAGTPLYLAPEIFTGGAASARSDIYSLGVLLYHLVTGEYPVRAVTFDGLEHGHAAQQAIRLRDARPDLPTAFVTAIDRALARDPGRRYASAGEFEADLARAIDARAPTPRRAVPGWALALAATALLALGLLAYRPWSAGPPAAVPAGPIHTIAVLPLRNDSGDPAQDYFADGMTDEIISRLGRLGGLQVISRTSTARFKGMQFDGVTTTLPEIGKALNAEAIIEGSIMLTPLTTEPRRVRVSARLISAGTDVQLWNQTFEALVSDVMTLEGEIATAIADGIRLQLSPQQQAAVAPRQQRQPDFEAFNLYLQGRASWNVRSRESVQRSIGLFQQAIVRDPQYAQPHAGLADAYNLLGSYGWLPFADANARAAEAATRAITLDGTVAEAHVSLAHVHETRFEWDAAEAGYRLAIELNPGSVTAHHWYGILLSKRGTFPAATAEIEKAMALDPMSPFLPTLLASFQFQQHNYEEAITRLERIVQAQPNYARAHFILAQAYAKTGRYDRALVAAERSSALGGDGTELRALIGCISAGASRKSEAMTIAEELIARYRDGREGGPMNIAVLYAVCNEPDRAFEWLDRAVRERDPLAAYLKIDPWFDGLRSDPRFEALLARLGLTR